MAILVSRFLVHLQEAAEGTRTTSLESFSEPIMNFDWHSLETIENPWNSSDIDIPRKELYGLEHTVDSV